MAAPSWRRRSRRAAGVLVALAVAASMVHASPATAASAWTLQTSPTTVNLLGLECSTFDSCGAVGALSGANGVGVYTSNGSSWATETTTGGEQLNAAACASGSADCWVAGNAGLILFTNGSTLTQETSPTTVNLLGVACPSASVCFAVGAKSGSNGVIAATTNGGTSWAAQTSTGGQQLNAIACSSTTSCWAVGNSGVIIHTANGTSWSTETSTTTVNLLGVACPSASVCFAVGAKSGSNGVILATTNGGSSWAAQTSTGGQQLNGISCPDTTHCWAVGNAGVVVATANGTSWATQTSNTTQALYGASFVNDGFGWAVGAGGVIDAYGCRAGSLSMTPPSSVTFPSTALNGLNQSLTLNASATVDDETASGAGWNLTATSTTFTATGSKTLPTTAATVTGVTAAAGTGNCTLPTNAISYPVTIPAGTTAPTAVKIYDAAATTGGGPVNLTLALKLAVPSSAKAGSYSSTWTFTIASGP